MGTLNNFALGDKCLEFLDMIPKAQTIKAKIDHGTKESPKACIVHDLIVLCAKA